MASRTRPSCGRRRASRTARCDAGSRGRRVRHRRWRARTRHGDPPGSGRDDRGAPRDHHPMSPPSHSARPARPRSFRRGPLWRAVLLRRAHSEGPSAVSRTVRRVGAIPSIVMPTPLTRRAWLLVLPMLVGALLLMHGLEARVGAHHPAPVVAPAAAVDVGSRVDPGDQLHVVGLRSMSGEHDDCAGCLAGHVMAACVAVITAIGGAALVRRLLARATVAASATLTAARMQGLAGFARPPDPPWGRLSVMRC